MRSLKILFWGGLAVLATLVFAGRKIADVFNRNVQLAQTNDAREALRQENLEGFHSIEVDGAFEVELVQGSASHIKLSGSEKDLANVVVSISDSTLHVRYQNGFNIATGHIQARIESPVLNRVDISGAVEVDCENGIKSRAFSIEMSGASNTHIPLETEELQIHLSGASNLTLSGTAGLVKAEGSGASHVYGEDLEAQVVRVHQSGASTFSMRAVRELHAEASGASHVTYHGTPAVVNVNKSGAASVVGEE
ncbi:MAG: head GIN domain-containing protein [Bacteroidia bacterium]|nr:head GIN domain-containing protein [Bacteroidia bacterium]